MLAKNMSNILPTIGLVLVLVIVSMMLISYFGINMNNNSGLGVLNRSATFEGFKEGLLVQEEEEGFKEKSNLM